MKENNLTVFLLQQSSDKNLMVPVGGAIVAGSDQRVVQAVASSYPGRSEPDLSMTSCHPHVKVILQGLRQPCYRCFHHTPLDGNVRLEEVAYLTERAIHPA